MHPVHVCRVQKRLQSHMHVTTTALVLDPNLYAFPGGRKAGGREFGSGRLSAVQPKLKVMFAPDCLLGYWGIQQGTAVRVEWCWLVAEGWCQTVLALDPEMCCCCAFLVRGGGWGLRHLGDFLLFYKKQPNLKSTSNQRLVSRAFASLGFFDRLWGSVVEAVRIQQFN